METPPKTEPITEADLARASGVAREDLKKMRGLLSPGVDWTGGAGRPVMITQSGQERVQELLRQDAAGRAKKEAPGPIARAVAASRGPDRYVKLRIVRVVHTRALLAKKDGVNGDAVVRVITRASTNFKVGMLLERCEPSTATPGVFYYHGKLPRRPGKF